MKISSSDIWASVSATRLKYAPSLPSVLYTTRTEAETAAKRANRERGWSGDEAESAVTLADVIQAISEVAANPWT